MANSLTTFLAIWGAVLGTIGTVVSIILAIREFKKDRHNLTIQADFSSGDLFEDGYSSYVVVSVLNTGFRPVLIRSVKIFPNYRQGRMKNNETLPQTLVEGRCLEIYFETDGLRKVPAEYIQYGITATVEDGQGTEHKYIFPKRMVEIIRKP